VKYRVIVFFLVTFSFIHPLDERRFEDIASGLRCPTCKGVSVLESEANFSNSMKDMIRKKMQLGRSKQEIWDYFVVRYGDWILRAPPKRGINWFIWLFPIVCLLLGFFLFLSTLLGKRYWHKSSPKKTRSREEILQEMLDRLEPDLSSC